MSVRSAFPTLGILGGGQLGRMMAVAAIPMGLHIRFLAPTPAGPMEGLGEQIVGDWKDPDVLRRFAKGCDVVTAESEWAPAEHVEALGMPHLAVRPTGETLRLIRDKGLQKQTLADAGLPAPDFRRCPTLADAHDAARAFGYPVLLKKYRGSYDGYGNATVRADAELDAAWAELADETGALVEAFVPFARELSVLVARRADGAHVVYPVAYTEQRDHRCHAVVVPAGIAPEVEARAREVGLAAVEAVNGIGLTAVELFELEDGQVLVNELAPRPHNTGHYTIEGARTSQFENHVRAVLGLPLGDPSLREGAAVMVNVLGHRSGPVQAEGFADALAVPGAKVHLYGKPEVRPKRKMGHVTVTGPDAADARRRAEEAAALIRL